MLKVVLLLIDSILRVTRVTKVARVARVTRVNKRIDSTIGRLSNYKIILELIIFTIDILLLVSIASITY